MTIAGRLRIAALMPGLMALVICGALFVSYRSIARLEGNERIAQGISEAFGELDDLARSYVVYHEERPRQQFQLKYGETTKFLAAAAFEDREQQVLLEEIEENAVAMNVLFRKVLANYERHGAAGNEALFREAEARLVGQLLIRSRDARTHASRLLALISRDILAGQRRLQALALSLMAAVAAPLTIFLFGLTRSIAASLDRVAEGTRIVGGGDLDHRIGMTSGDEIGVLAQAFDDMSAKLKATTVSRDALAAEAAERKRAEGSAVHLASFPQRNPNPVLELDVSGKVRYRNPATRQLLEQLGLDPGNAAVLLPADLDGILEGWDGKSESILHREITVGPRVFAETVHFVPQFGVVRIYAADITRGRRAEYERETTVEFLRLINESRDTSDLVRAATHFVHQRSGCEAVGIRLRQGDDYPYFETRGFPEEFVHLENSLCARDRSGHPIRDGAGNPVIDCMCGNVICGRFDPSKPFFTAGGSFWSNCTTDLLASTTEADRQARTRNRCNGEGYESVALISLSLGEDRIGLLQLNDRRKGMFSAESVALWERLAAQLAVALSKFRADDALRTANEELESRVAARTAELSESEERFRTVVEKSPIGVFIVRDGRTVFRNPEYDKLFGTLAEGGEFVELRDVHPDDAARFEQFRDAVSPGSERPMDIDVRFFPRRNSPEGTAMAWVQLRTVPIEYQGRGASLVTAIDVTREKELEELARLREKMAVLGQVSAGIAHEIRNPLSGINLYLSSLEQFVEQSEGTSPEEKERCRVVAAQMRSASSKIAAVIKRVMDFTRPVAPRLEPIDLNTAVVEAVQLSMVALRQMGVTLEQSLDPDLPACPADPGLIEQVLMNLLDNAAHAMQKSEGPRLIEVASSLESGRVVIRVSDSGPGIPPHMRSRIFDAFFTTRKDGYGFGLSFSHRVITHHGGSLSVGTSRWGGAEFRIEIPVS